MEIFHSLGQPVWDISLLLWSECVSFKKLDVEILTPKEDGIRGWGLGRCLGHKGEVFRNGISVFIEGTPKRSLARLPYEDTVRKR